jgi:carbamate kinase
MLDFGRPTQRALDEIDVDTAERHQRDGHFAAGSMGPKVHAATQFLRAGGQVAVISKPEFAARTLDLTGDAPQNGRDEPTGTRILASRRTAQAAT